MLALQTLVSRDDIIDREDAHMAHMQLSAWIRKHRQAIVFFLVGIFANFETSGLVPEFLSGQFNRFGIVGGTHR